MNNVSIDSMDSMVLLKKTLNDDDKKKYESIGLTYYNMLNFNDLEHPTEENIKYMKNLIQMSATNSNKQQKEEELNALVSNMLKKDT